LTSEPEARDAILGRLAAAGRPAERPGPWRSRRRFDDLAERFTQALTAAGGEVWRADGLPEAIDRAGRVLHEMGARLLVADDDPLLAGLELEERWPGVECRVAGRPVPGPAPGLRAACAAADAGLSVAVAALAETGTVIVASGPGRSRLTGLLPPVHLALVPLSRLTTDLFTWVAGRTCEWPAALTLITGPSKTADIEQTMAIGVHGPGRFIAILYQDAAGLRSGGS
jgi:L-lactate utilization protein LutC